MSDVMLLRFFHPNYGPRIGVQLGEHVYDVSDVVQSVAAWLQVSAGQAEEAITVLRQVAEGAAHVYPVGDFDTPAPDSLHFLAPVDQQEVWAAGVTYQRSQVARQEEALDGGDIYARVYAAERPELFFKAHGAQVIGPGGAVGIRADATWNVPEPELGLVINPALQVVGLTVGNDMSSRDIEGANPLYLPQAKVYTASCALGPGLLLGVTETWPDTTIRLRITRAGQEVFSGDVSTRQIHRAVTELVSYLGRSLAFPQGAVLLTGTGIVPPADFTLAAGDVVTITIDGIGTLSNTVHVV
ncbi:MAG: fumarylacetoacetate hydrolase family protein [Anaerolineae bacterium]|nr:fumarylacetoacetate hydrolase family protein [Anaerolineae bacterium]